MSTFDEKVEKLRQSLRSEENKVDSTSTEQRRIEALKAILNSSQGKVKTKQFSDDYFAQKSKLDKNMQDIVKNSIIADRKKSAAADEIQAASRYYNIDSGLNIGDYERRIHENTAKIENLETAANKLRQAATEIDLGGETPAAKKKFSELTAQYGNISDLEKQIEDLKAENWKYEREKKYNFLEDNADFRTRSGVEANDPTTKFGIGVGKSWLGVGDPVYDYINNLDNARQKNMPLSNPRAGNPYAVYDLMNEDEIARYNYLYNTQGSDAARDYLDYIEYGLNIRRNMDVKRNATEFATEAPVAATVASVPLNLASGIGFVDVAVQKTANKIKENITGEYGRPVDYYRGAMSASVASTAIRGTISQNIADSTGTIQLNEETHPILSKILNGKSLGNVYQLGMSIVDSAAVAALSPVIGSAGSVLLGGSAAAQGVLDAVANGANDEQALTMGTLNGLFEMLFEKWSLENLLNGDTKGLVKIALQALVEGSEEVNTSFANFAADLIIMAEKSDYSQNVAAYIEAGLSEEEAKKQAIWDVAIQLGWDFIGGMASGGVMGSISAPIINANENAYAKKLYGGSQTELVAEALKIDPDNSYAQRMQERLEEGKNLSGRQLRKLVEQNEKAINQMPSSEETEVAEEPEAESTTETEALKPEQYRDLLKAAQIPQTDTEIKMSVNTPQMQTAAETAQAESVVENSQQMTGKSTGKKTLQVDKESLTTAEEYSEVPVEEVAYVKDGKMYLKLADGSTVNSEDANYGSFEEAIFYETVAQMNTSTRAANVLVNGFNAVRGDSQAAKNYAQGIEEAFLYGQIGIPMKELAKSDFASKLNKGQQEYAYRQGQKAAGSQTSRQQAAVSNKGRTKKTSAIGKVHFDRNGRTFDQTREASLETMEQLSKLLGVEFYVYESYVNEDGLRVYKNSDGKEVSAPNGFYDYKTGAIHIDLNAGETGKGTMLFTVAHELTHFIKAWSPAKFRVLANFLADQYAENGVSVSDLVRQQMDKAKRNGISLKWDEAYEEMVADSMEAMLTDGNVVQMMADLKQQDKTLWKKICDWFKNLVNDLKKLVEAYEGYKPDSPEGRMVADMQDTIVILESIYADALADASENFQMAEKNTANSAQSTQGVASAASESARQKGDVSKNSMRDENEKVNVKFSVLTAALEHFGRTYSWKETGYLLTNGAKLDFSGKHEGASGGYRTVDHREILDIYPENAELDGNGAMVDFMKQGNIRIMPEGNGINLSVKPTKAQEQALDDFISRARGEVTLDIDDDRGNTVVSVEYPRFTRSTKVIQDIRNYFDTGAEPVVSHLSQFRYSNRWNGVTQAEIDAIQNIGRISVNSFTSKDLNAVKRYSEQYWKLMGVKSPFFRAWFGDWRANDRKTPVKVANQVGKDRGIQHNDDTGWDIQVSGKVFNETRNHAAPGNRAARVYLPYINDIVKKAVLLDSYGIDPSKEKSSNSLLMHSLYAVADIGNGPEVLKLYVEEMNDPNKADTGKRAYQLQNIEISSPTGANDTESSGKALASFETADVRTVADLFVAVKNYDSNFLPNSPSKIVNADGTPKVMYHGSPAQFTIFDKKKAKSSGLYGKGFYFTDSDSQAGVYGNRYAVYLNIRNPLESGSATVDRKQVRKFLETVAENEDYSIENYGTYDVDVILERIMDGKSSIDAFRMLQDINATAIGDLVEATELFNSVNGTEFDGIVVPTEVIAFRPEQIKSATDNIGTFDSSNPDIRYSDRDPAAKRVNEVLQKENAKLKEDVQYLKDLVKIQKTVTSGTKFTKSSVEAMAGNLMKANNVKGSKQELAKLLNGLYEYIAKGEELTWDGVKEMAQPAVQWLRKNTVIRSELSEYAKEILRDVRASRISLDESQMAEATYRYGSYNDFRKTMMGSVTVSKDGLPLDIQWQEWASKYPDIFDADITASDMPGALADVISSLRKTDLTRTEYAYHADMIEQDLLQQVYDGYWRVSTLYTVADVKQRQITALKGKHAQQMNDLRQFHRAKTDQLKQAHREEVKRIRNEYREDSQKKQQEIIKRYQDARDRNVEGRKKTAMRHKIQNVVKELNSLLLSNDKKHHVPDNLKKAVAAALDLVNMDTVDAENRASKYADLITKEQKKANPDQNKIDAYTVTMENILRQGDKMGNLLKELHIAYEEIQNSDDPDIVNAYDPVIAGAIQELSATIGNTSIKNMTMEQLSDVYDVYRMVLIRVQDANKAMVENIKASIEELAKSTIREVQAVGGSQKYRVAVLDPIRKFGFDNLKPVYAMERIGSSTLTDVFNNVRAGEDIWAMDVSEARAYYLEKSKKYGYNKWDFDKKYRFKSNSGIPFELTLEQMMSLYAYSRRNQAIDHLRLGGFVFDSNIETTKEGKNKLVKYKVNTADAHQITPEIMADIVGTLTKEQISFVEEMQEYLSTVMGAKGNEVTSKMYGVKLFKEKFYFPLKSAKQFMFEQNEVAGEVKIKNSGFTNKVVAKANNPVILSNFMDVWCGHVNDMSMYHAFTLPLEDFNRVFNYNSPKREGVEPVSVKGTIQNAYSPIAVQYVKNLITDLNGGAVSDPRETNAKAMMSRFKKAKVMASLSVIIQQPTSIARAFALVDPKYFRPTKDGKGHEELWNELKRYAPVAVIKEMGYFDTNMGKSTQDFITSKEYSGFKEKAKAIFTDSNYRDEMLSRLPALADELAWCAIWNAVKRETLYTHKELRPGSEAFLKAAGERFTEVVTKTQVYDSVLARSSNMRSKTGLMNMVTSFMAEPTTTINMLEDAIVKGKRGNKRYAARAFASVATATVLNNALVAIIYAMRDDDEDETYWEKYLEAFVSGMLDDFNPLTYYPFLKDIWSLLQGYNIERADMSLISDLADAMKTLVKEYSKEDGNVAGAWWDLTETVANLGGIPVQNIRREVNGVINFYNTLSQDLTGRATTSGSVRDAVQETVRGSLPVIGWVPGETKADKLYDAIISGDTQYVERLKNGYKTDDAYHSAIRKGLRENDGRIREAAIALNEKDLDKYMRIANEIIGEKNFTFDDVSSAIRSEASALAPDDGVTSTSKAKGLFTPKEFSVAVEQGDMAIARSVKADIIETSKKNGKTAEEAEKNFQSEARSQVKELLAEKSVSDSYAEKMLVTFGGYESDEAADRVSEWKYEMEHPELDGRITYTQYKRWETDGKSRGIDLNTFIKVAEYRDNGTSESVKSQDEVRQYIEAIAKDNKTRHALWCCFYKESTSPYQ